jgi:16S rRNA processing protein RimM
VPPEGPHEVVPPESPHEVVPPASPDDEAALEAGRVGRPHGLDGAFYVTGARPRLLAVGTVVVIAGRTFEVVRRAGVQERPILRLRGIEDRTAVEALRGRSLSVPATQAPTLPAGEWWEHELVGCAVLDGERSVGTVSGLLELPSCEVLQVRRGDGGELLVPMVADAVRRVDVAGRRIEVSLEFLGER